MGVTYSPAEAEAFLSRNAGNPTLAAYLESRVALDTGLARWLDPFPQIGHDPAWGITLWEGDRQILVYQATLDDQINVVDITNEPIAAQIDEAPFRSPDDTGFWGNFQNDFLNFLSQTQSAFSTGVMLVGVGLALVLVLQSGILDQD